MKIYLVFVFLLLTKSTSAKLLKIDYTLECKCINDLVLKEKLGTAKMLDSRGKKSCVCESTDSGKDGTYYTGHTGEFSVKANKHTYVTLMCDSTSGSVGGYVVKVPVWTEEGNDLHCSIDQKADQTQPTIFLCHNPTHGMKHFKIDSYNCVDYGVVGHWVGIQHINAPTDIETMSGIETGTSTELSNSVTNTVSAGLELDNGSGVSASASASQSATCSASDSRYWTQSEYLTVKTHYDEAYVGKEVWQFQYNVVDPWDNLVTVKTSNLITTASAGQPPKCIPGYTATTQDGQPDDQNCCYGEDGYMPPIPATFPQTPGPQCPGQTSADDEL